MDQLTGEWQKGILWCELREFETYGLQQAVHFGEFRFDEWADVRERVEHGSHKLCDIMNVVAFKALPEGVEFTNEDAFDALVSRLSVKQELHALTR